MKKAKKEMALPSKRKGFVAGFLHSFSNEWTKTFLWTFFACAAVFTKINKIKIIFRKREEEEKGFMLISFFFIFVQILFTAENHHGAVSFLVDSEKGVFKYLKSRGKQN